MHYLRTKCWCSSIVKAFYGSHNYCSSLNSSRVTSTEKKPILYGDEASPPVRFVLMTASMLNSDLEFRQIDLFKAENRSDFYKKINPLQKVPALQVNNGDVICESHAIALYFCRNSTNKELYPEDTIIRAKIDEMLFYNSGVLFPIDSALFTDLFAGRWPADKTMINSWISSMDYLDLKLSGNKWLTGDKLRLCDLCCGSTVSSLGLLIPLLDRHGNVKKWLENLKTIPESDLNTRGLKRLQSFVETV